MSLLLDFTVKISIVLLLALAATWALRRRSAALRHWVLAASLACAAVLPVVQMALPAWQLPGIAQPLVSAVNGARATPVALASSLPPSPAVPATAQRRTPEWPLQQVIAAIWMSGTLLFGALLSIASVRMARLARRVPRIADGVWVENAREIARELGLAPPTLLAGDRTSLLATWGARTPKLLVPDIARDWPAERVRLVLYHELAHVQRRDWIVQCGAELVRVACWFNPLIWIVCARLRQESEQACDDDVINRGVEGTRYAAHVVEIARDLRHRRAWMPAPAIAHSSGFERRVRAMLDTGRNRRPITPRAAFTTALVVLACALPIAAMQAGVAKFTGLIVDPTNAVLPGVALTLTNTATGVTQVVQTDRQGRYEFGNLAVGDYAVEAKLPGFAVFKGTLKVAGQDIQRDLALELGSLQETVTVALESGPPPAIDPERARKSEEMRIKRAAETCPGGARDQVPAIGGNIRTPSKLKHVSPVYPTALGSARVTGQVQMIGHIGVDGNMRELNVVSASHPDFASAAVTAVRQWQFDPTLLNCLPVEVTMTVAVKFVERP